MFFIFLIKRMLSKNKVVTTSSWNRFLVGELGFNLSYCWRIKARINLHSSTQIKFYFVQLIFYLII